MPTDQSAVQRGATPSCGEAEASAATAVARRASWRSAHAASASAELRGQSSASRCKAATVPDVSGAPESSSSPSSAVFARWRRVAKDGALPGRLPGFFPPLPSVWPPAWLPGFLPPLRLLLPTEAPLAEAGAQSCGCKRSCGYSGRCGNGGASSGCAGTRTRSKQQLGRLHTMANRGSRQQAAAGPSPRWLLLAQHVVVDTMLVDQLRLEVQVSHAQHNTCTT